MTNLLECIKESLANGLYSEEINLRCLFLLSSMGYSEILQELSEATELHPDMVHLAIALDHYNLLPTYMSRTNDEYFKVFDNVLYTNFDGMLTCYA
jgi:hypothetical protein